MKKVLLLMLMLSLGAGINANTNESPEVECREYVNTIGGTNSNINIQRAVAQIIAAMKQTTSYKYCYPGTSMADEDGDYVPGWTCARCLTYNHLFKL